jgi:hypothetical protein
MKTEHLWSTLNGTTANYQSLDAEELSAETSSLAAWLGCTLAQHGCIPLPFSPLPYPANDH